MVLTGLFITGAPFIQGGENSKRRCKKIRKKFSNMRNILSLFQTPKSILQEDSSVNEFLQKEELPLTFHLHSETMHNGDVHTKGTGAYVFPEGVDLDHLERILKWKKINMDDKEYHISAFKAHICQECNLPIEGELTSNELDSFYLVDKSSVDENFCRICSPNWNCSLCGGVAYTPVENPDESQRYQQKYLSMQKFMCCISCSNDSKLQEEWRNIGSGSKVKFTKTNYVEEKHLCDEAIQKIQEKMGGKPQSPQEDLTPFILWGGPIDELLNPDSLYYWPFGMSSREYLEYHEKRKFNNPRSEEYYMGIDPEFDDDWQDIEVTDSLIEEYIADQENICEKYPTREDLPIEISYEGENMRLLSKVHSFTCDSSRCQAIFQSINNDERLPTLSFTTIPMYTSRGGDLSGPIRDLTYGFERCLACIDRE